MKKKWIGISVAFVFTSTCFAGAMESTTSDVSSGRFFLGLGAGYNSVNLMELRIPPQVQFLLKIPCK